MVRRLLDAGLSVSDATWSQIMPTAGAMVANQAQVTTQILDFYLCGDGKEYWGDVVMLAKAESTPENEDRLLRYCMEAIRLHGTFGSYRSASTACTVDDEGFSGHKEIKAGDKVFVSFVCPPLLFSFPPSFPYLLVLSPPPTKLTIDAPQVRANRDPHIFASPNTVRLDRPMDSYIHYGVGPHACLGKEASQVGLTAMVRVMARLPGLRPAPGPQGVCKKVAREDGFYAYMTEVCFFYFFVWFVFVREWGARVRVTPR